LGVTGQTVASLVDELISVSLGICFIWQRDKVVAKISDPEKRRKVSRWLTLGALVVIIGGLTRMVLTAAAVEDDATTFAREINQIAPRQIDISTRLDRAVALPGNRVALYLTITTFNGADVNLPMLRLSMQNHLESPRAVDFFKLAGKATVVMHYLGKDGGYVGEITLEPLGSGKRPYAVR
jgi:hypothetical protein